MVSLIFWFAVIQWFYVRNRKLKCPHCHENGVNASKILHLGPSWSFRCSVCGKKHKASFWFLPLTLLTGAAIGFIMMNSYFKPDDKILNFPTSLAIPVVLMLDMVSRFYWIPLKKK